MPASANAQHTFGTAVNDLETTTADSTCPSINNFLWDRSDEGDYDWLDIQVECEFNDNAAGNVDFWFDFTLIVELWYVSPSMYKGPMWSDNWTVDDMSGNWLNSPPSHDNTLTVSVLWRTPASNEQYKCTLHVSIENEATTDTDYESDSWFITMQW
jgi:hypothetical protein